MKNVSITILTIALAACGSSPSDSRGDGGSSGDGGNNSGGNGDTVQGRKLEFSHGIIFTNGNTPGARGNTATIILSNQSDLCDTMKTHVTPKNLDMLNLQLVHRDEQAINLPLTTGQYIVTSPSEGGDAPRIMAASVSASDDKCAPLLDSQDAVAMSGSVTLDAVDVDVVTAGGAQGTYELFFAPFNEKLSGSFDAVFCEDATRPAGGPKVECES